MPDPLTLTTLLLTGAQLVGDAAVKEATRDAYAALKAKVGALFGPRAAKAAEKLGAEATRHEGRAELERYVPDMTTEETDQLTPLIQDFRDALSRDEVARQIVKSTRIGLDLDVGGNILLDDLQGVGEMAVKAKADGDFTLARLRMDAGERSGN